MEAQNLTSGASRRVEKSEAWRTKRASRACRHCWRREGGREGGREGRKKVRKKKEGCQDIRNSGK